MCAQRNYFSLQTSQIIMTYGFAMTLLASHSGEYLDEWKPNKKGKNVVAD